VGSDERVWDVGIRVWKRFLKIIVTVMSFVCWICGEFGGIEERVLSEKGRGLTEVGCWMHARRYFYKALESDEARMGPALHLIARLYAVEERARALQLTAEQRLELRGRLSAPVMEKLHRYIEDLKPQVLPKSPAGAAVRYALNQWKALNVYLEDGELEIDNGATERANRDIAVGRGNWTFFGSDTGGRTAAILRTFVASCKRNGVEPFAWFRDVLSRLSAHPINRIAELLPHTWKPSQQNA